MTNSEKYIKDVLNGFQTNKGKGYTFCFTPFKFEELIYNLIYKYRLKRPDTQILIVTDAYPKILKLSECFRQNNLSTTDIKMLTESYININRIYTNNLIIFVDVTKENIIERLSTAGHFNFAVFTKSTIDTNYLLSIREILPEINVDINNNGALQDRVNSPVEEHRISVELSDNDRKQYDKCDEYVKQSITIFGDFGNIQKCRLGDENRNVSAADFRQWLAESNGWKYDLDTSVEFNKQIDEVYNPNALFERANLIYNITRERLNLVTDYEGKLPVIANIIKNNPDKKIMIISKRGEFANKIFNYLNNDCGITCGAYHDSIESQYVKDENGEVINIKSGTNKGKPRIFCARALSNLYLDHYNINAIKVLVVKSNIDTKIKCNADILIFTSPFCIDINEFLVKYINIDLPTPIITYKIYCNNTSEYKEISKPTLKQNVTIIEDEKNIEYNTESGDIIL